MTDPALIVSAVDGAISRCGRLDAVVDDAGYLLVGTCGSMDEARIARQFETKVFGLTRVVRTVLPHSRFPRAGVPADVAGMAGRTASFSLPARDTRIPRRSGRA